MASERLTVLDLFSGIGGFSLGLERTGGFRTIAFCEIEPFQRAVLRKHWPEVPCHDDVRTLTAARLEADGLARPDVICGGFPCQDVSGNGKRAGLKGARSGLWFEYLRLIGEIRPRYVIIENVADLRTRGLDVVLGGLDALGYVGEWHCIEAAAIGARHDRDRAWIVAVGDAARGGRREHRHEFQATDGGAEAGQPAVPGSGVARWPEPIVGFGEIERQIAAHQWRRAEPRVVGEADGLSARLDGDRPVEPWEGNTSRVVPPGYPDRRRRLIALGNAIVPQVAELIGRAILRAEGLETLHAA